MAKPIKGTKDDDLTLNGTAGNDTIQGKDGNDYIIGLAEKATTTSTAETVLIPRSIAGAMPST
jgi:Ca2+-binding RTX toxin-like protein